MPKAVTDELALMDRADLLVLQYPMWWHLPPAMLKGWFDRVLAYGEAYTSSKRFENGRFVGKRAMLSVTVGTSRNTYAYDGRSGDIDLMLWPVNFSLAYVGYDVLAPFVAYGVEAGLRYSDPAVVEERLRAIVADFCATLPRHHRARDDSLQPHGGMGRGRPHRRRRAGPLAIRPPQAAPRIGMRSPPGQIQRIEHRRPQRQQGHDDEDDGDDQRGLRQRAERPARRA